MNWLAHVFLSSEDVEFRLGNLLADLVRGPACATMSEPFRRGAEHHRAIDAYTDSHPVVKRSRGRIGTAHRRFSGVLVDVFYDYLLATRWDVYSAVPLKVFTARFYDDVQRRGLALPDPAAEVLERIVGQDLLGAYRRIEGVEHSLRSISLYLTRRWKKPFALERAVADLVADETGFAQDFAEFFPELQAHSRRRLG